MLLSNISNKFFFSLIALITLVIVLYCGKFINSNYLETNDEYKMIQTYLLNDSPLYGFDKPKLWIHTKYEINARKWKSFQSRNTTDLNQPFIHLTIKTIVNYCSNDFNICLIDDDTFGKLLPNWDIDLMSVAEPMKTRIREMGLLKLVYYYGGMVIPNSFICCRNLKEMFEQYTADGRAFICENVNRTENLVADKHHRRFLPDLYCFGATKNNETIKEMVEFMKAENREPHFSSEPDFVGDFQMFALSLVSSDNDSLNLVSGEWLGVKTMKNKIVGVEDLMSEGFLELNPSLFGLYLPADDILKRTHYSWFNVLSRDELMKSNVIAMKYMISSLVDSTDDFKIENREMRSVVAI